MQRFTILILALAVIAVIDGCSRRSPRTTRLDPKDISDIGTDWNDTDTTETTKALVMLITTSPWIEEFMAAHAMQKPRIKVGSIVVRAGGDIINSEILTESITIALLKTGKVKATQPRGDEWQTVKELERQDVHATEETRKRAFSELAADFLLTGFIMSEDQQGVREMVRSYTTVLTLVDIQTAEVIWKDKHVVKKAIAL